MENSEVLVLKSRIQVLETLLKSKDLELENARNTLQQVLEMTSGSSVVIESKPAKKNVDFRFVPESHLVMRGDATVKLTSREFLILTRLYNNKDKPCTREQLLEDFQDSPDMTERNIDVHVFSLRRKLQKVDMGVETVWGVGYKMVA